jgi:hypothetical protein
MLTLSYTILPKHLKVVDVVKEESDVFSRDELIRLENGVILEDKTHDGRYYDDNNNQWERVMLERNEEYFTLGYIQV